MKYKLLMTIIVILFWSCEKELDSILPEDNVITSSVFSTELGSRSAVIGIYSTAQDKDAFGGTTMSLDAFWADDARFVGTFTTFRNVRDYAMLSDNGSIEAVWRDLYQVIGAANNAIIQIPLSPDTQFQEAARNQLVGEAKFLRALSYFNLANNFSQPYQFSNGSNDCVPLVTEVFSDPSQLNNFKLKRNTLNEIHQFIEDELLEAKDLLPVSIGGPGRASTGAAQALLARLKLYREEWETAANLANDVINTGTYQLSSDYTFYDKATSEDVFTIINTSDDGQDANIGLSEFFNPVQAGGRGDAPYSENLLEAYDQLVDRRFIDLNQEGRDAARETSIFTSKFPDGENRSDNIPIIRITEMYLIRAEANLRNGTAIGADPLDDINLLRNRAGLSDLTTITTDDILIERRKELAFEGHRRMDLLRYKKSLRRPGMDNEEKSVFGADQTVFPIPQRDRDQNPELSQNPGY